VKLQKRHMGAAQNKKKTREKEGAHSSLTEVAMGGEKRFRGKRGGVRYRLGIRSGNEKTWGMSSCVGPYPKSTRLETRGIANIIRIEARGNPNIAVWKGEAKGVESPKKKNA